MDNSVISRMELLLMLFTELRDFMKQNSEANDEEQRLLKMLDTTLYKYRRIIEHVSKERIEEKLKPFVPQMEQLIYKVAAKVDYQNLTSQYKEIEDIEKKLSNCEELTDSEINFLLDRRKALLNY